MSLRVYWVVNVILALLGLVNIVWASLGLLQAQILFFLTSPAAIFSNFVREMGHSGAAAETDHGE
ncbi:MAG: hypothetical protein ACRDWF_08020 [Acidimicrobiia bacterium]